MGRAPRLRAALLSTVSVLALIAAPAYAETAGVAAAVNPATRGTPPTLPTRTIALGQNILQNESIVTDAGGLLQILLADGTTFTVGPNSALVIDRFVYDPAAGTAEVAATVTRGVFRFIGGRTSKTPGGAVLRTPVGTLGIRGGMVDVNLAPRQQGLKAHFDLIFGTGATLTQGGSAGPDNVAGQVRSQIARLGTMIAQHEAMRGSAPAQGQGGSAGDALQRIGTLLGRQHQKTKGQQGAAPPPAVVAEGQELIDRIAEAQSRLARALVMRPAHAGEVRGIVAELVALQAEQARQILAHRTSAPPPGSTVQTVGKPGYSIVVGIDGRIGVQKTTPQMTSFIQQALAGKPGTSGGAPRGPTDATVAQGPVPPTNSHQPPSVNTLSPPSFPKHLIDKLDDLIVPGTVVSPPSTDAFDTWATTQTTAFFTGQAIGSEINSCSGTSYDRVGTMTMSWNMGLNAGTIDISGFNSVTSTGSLTRDGATFSGQNTSFPAFSAEGTFLQSGSDRAAGVIGSFEADNGFWEGSGVFTGAR